jgi:pyruvate/2-oxoglutarate dehydrogenase complex dihydrolipoamide dehydrogenase (E3) component
MPTHADGSENEVDVVVLGLGPGGEAAANKLASAGLRVVAVDKHLVGGECPYYGCIPSKMMIRAADSLAEARRVTKLAGASTTASSWAPVASRIRDEATADWDDTIAVQRLEKAGATVVRGAGRLTGPRTVEVEGTSYRAGRAVVLNTGTRPAVPPIEGLAGLPYWTNREVVKVTELPRSLAVLGGGAIGCELAQVFARFGVEVTLLESAPRIMVNEEPEASEVMTRVFADEGITVLTDLTVTSASYADGRFTMRAGDREVEAEKLLVAVGRITEIADIGLDSVGVDGGARSLETDEWLRVTRDGEVVDGLWAVGDITGKGQFTHVSMYQSGVAVRSILGEGGPAADYRAVPRVTFTDPEVGSVGMTEKQARDAGLEVRTAQVDLGDTTRGFIHKVGNEGLLKLVAVDDLLVGATSVGPRGGEVLSMLTTAIHGKVPVSALGNQVFAYPTFHGGVRDALSQLE